MRYYLNSYSEFIHSKKKDLSFMNLIYKIVILLRYKVFNRAIIAEKHIF